MTALRWLLAALLWPAAVLAAGEGFNFQHQDWEIACDNTRTCRAAGYQREDGEAVEPVSVLLTRKAGPREPVTGELTLGSADDDTLARLPQPLRLSMRVNGKAVGQVTFAKDATTAALSAEQVAALLAVLPRSADVEWRTGDARWRLSDKGAAAVLLKMDEFQGRLGTAGALVRKGTADEAQVRPAVPTPVVRLAHASHKGRGIGDCWGNDEWAWDGSRFVQTLVSTTGMCRMVAPGGAWTLPTFVSDVK